MWKAPAAGEFRDRIKIERKSNVSDGMGGVTDAWTVVADDIPARIEAARGSEAVRSKRLSGVTTFDIVIRRTANTDFTAGDRLTDIRAEVVMNILWCGSLDRDRRYLVLTCEAGGVQNG